MIKTNNFGEISHVEVIKYDASWIEQFEREAQALRLLLRDQFVAAHHIGSTAIPGILAKPIIDILLEVREIEVLPTYDALLRERGYRPLGAYGLTGRLYYPKNVFGIRTYQLHAWQSGHPAIIRHLAFRDFMMTHPQAAERYGQLKLELVARYNGDRTQYVDGKHDFVKRFEERALAWQAQYVSQQIETERLRLIPLTAAQLRLGLERRYLLESELGVQLSASVFSAAATSAIKTKLHRMARTHSELHVWDTYWMMIVAGAQAGVGLIGFKGAPNREDAVELGYGVEPKWRGQGIASEATQALINWALAQPACKTVTAWTEIDNYASKRVLQKSGLVNTRERAGQLFWRTQG